MTLFSQAADMYTTEYRKSIVHLQTIRLAEIPSIWTTIQERFFYSHSESAGPFVKMAIILQCSYCLLSWLFVPL